MDSSGDDSSGFGPDSLEIMSKFILLACVSIMASGLGSKTKGERRATLTYGRVLVIALYTASWAFAAISIMIISTDNGNMTSCTVGMIACDVFYAGCKMFIYAWLIERVHLVSATRSKRLGSTQYRFHLGILSLYVGIFFLMLSFRNNYLVADGKCIIGFRLAASIPTVVYDSIVNMYLTFLFVRPLAKDSHAKDRKEWRQTRFYKLTRRTLLASAVCFLVSFANGLVIVITRGHLRGLVCLTLCNLDITINVLVLHWTTSTSNRMTHIHDAGHMFQTDDTNIEDGSKSIISGIVEPPTTQRSTTASAVMTYQTHSSVKQTSREIAIGIIDSRVIRAGTAESGVVHFGSYNLASSHRSLEHDVNTDDKHDESDSIRSLQSSVRPLQDR